MNHNNEQKTVNSKQIMQRAPLSSYGASLQYVAQKPDRYTENRRACGNRHIDITTVNIPFYIL